MGKQKTKKLFDLDIPQERKFTYLEESPTIVENTNEVANHYENSRTNSKIFNTFSRRISPNTRYFRFNSPKMNGYNPLVGSSHSKYFKEYAENAESCAEFERKK